MTPQDLIDFFGSRKAVCEFFDIKPPSFFMWEQNGVPLLRQYEAQVRTAGRLVAIAPANSAKLGHGETAKEAA